MSERNDQIIREAIDRITPAEGAKERMLQNIRRKAEAENATKQKQRKSRRMLFYKTLPAVAAVVIVVVGALVLKDRLAKKPADTPANTTTTPDGSVIAGGAVETHVISYSKAEFVRDIEEMPQLPKEAKEVTYHRDVYGYYMEFAVGEHRYQLYVFRPQGDKMCYVAVNYASKVLVDEWEQGQNPSVYRLVNSDGATKEDMEAVKAEIR